ncbi:MAG: stalk domain-containing protein [Bacillota bacterium]
MRNKLTRKKLSAAVILLIFTLSIAMATVAYTGTSKAVSMELSDDNVTLGIGESMTIEATAKYDDSSESLVRLLAEWTSSNPDVAAVDSGTVEALKEGSTVITAEYDGIKATATVTVTKSSISALKLSESNIAIDINGTYQLYLTAVSSNGVGSDVTEYAEWTTSDPSVLTVSAGKITAIGTGKAAVTAKYESFSATAEVNVEETRISEITLSESGIHVIKNGVASVQAIAHMEDGTTADVTLEAEWTSSDEDIFLVEEGQIGGVSNGKGTVTASFKGFSAKAEVTVGTTIVLQIGNPKMNVMGTEKEIDPGRGTSPIVISGRTLLPIRALIEELGGTVEWDDYDKKVTIELNMKKIELWINKKDVLVDAEPATLDVAPQIVNGRTVIPLRFVSETLGYDVEWDGDSKKITIND